MTEPASKVYDASALLAVIFGETGADAVIEHLTQPGGAISAVNWAEAASKLAERGVPEPEIVQAMASFALEVVAFDEPQALLVATLRRSTRALGLSLGDHCCLALAKTRAANAITADRQWSKIKGITVTAVR